jgi:WD40 repeat protein
MDTRRYPSQQILNYILVTTDKYLIMGGESDFIEIFAFPDLRIVARGLGHHSWVSSIKCDVQAHSAGYRFASAGQDGILSIWTFNPNDLRKPRTLVCLLCSTFWLTSFSHNPQMCRYLLQVILSLSLQNSRTKFH